MNTIGDGDRSYSDPLCNSINGGLTFVRLNKDRLVECTVNSQLFYTDKVYQLLQLL